MATSIPAVHRSGLAIDNDLTRVCILVATGSAISYYTFTWILRTFYVLYRHPLRNFPGPKLPLVFPLLFTLLDISNGKGAWRALKWHEQYGEVLRSGADSLSFTTPAAWNDIYGRRGLNELQKSRPRGLRLGPPDILEADTREHARYRRIMSPAFSSRAIRQQEPIVRIYVELLLAHMRDTAEASRPVDISRLFNHLTFDIVGDLAFGVSLGGLSDGKTNPWIESIQQTIRFLPILAILQRFGGIAGVLKKLFASRIRKHQLSHRAHVERLLAERLKQSNQDCRADFVNIFTRVRSDGEGDSIGLHNEELARNLDTLMVAGSETVATLLAGVISYLSQSPSCFKQCVSEIRGAFDCDEDIDMTTANHLPYLRACLQETLRLYPPVPIALGRRTPPDRALNIASHLVPPQTNVGIPPLAAFRLSSNWSRPHEFRPERWLPGALKPNSPYFKDKRDVHKPFSFGPRDCIGTTLAWQESSLVLARMLWEFDLELCAKSKNWVGDQKVFGLWNKPPLWVSVRPRVLPGGETSRHRCSPARGETEALDP